MWMWCFKSKYSYWIIDVIIVHILHEMKTLSLSLSLSLLEKDDEKSESWRKLGRWWWKRKEKKCWVWREHRNQVVLEMTHLWRWDFRLGLLPSLDDDPWHTMCVLSSLSPSVFFNQIFLLSFWLESASNLRLKHEGRNCYLVRRTGKERIGKDKEGRKWKCAIVPRKEKRIRSPSLSLSWLRKSQELRAAFRLFRSGCGLLLSSFPSFLSLSPYYLNSFIHTISLYLFLRKSLSLSLN